MTETLTTKTIKGVEYWVGRFWRDGKRIDRSFGRTSKITKTQAKKALREVVKEYDLRAAARPGVVTPTFGALLPLALKDIAAIKRWKNERSLAQWKQSLNDYALPLLGKVPIDEIDTNRVFEVLEPIWTLKPETASRVRSRIEAIIDWATVRGYRTGPNPAIWKGNLRLLLPPKSKLTAAKHHEAPTMDELRLAVDYCLAHPSPVSGLLLWVTATACRVTEARLMQAAEIVDGVWHVPDARMKTQQKVPYRVPVSTLAKRALAMGNKRGLVFTSSKSPLHIDSARLKLVDIVGRKLTVHGIRSTFRDWCAREGVPDAVAEKALSHQWGDATVQAYYRDDLLDARRELLERWARQFLRE